MIWVVKKRLSKKMLAVSVTTILVASSVAVGVIYYTQKSVNNPSSKVIPSEPKIESDVVTLSVDEFKQKYADSIELKNELILAGYNKEVFAKNDEALNYYEEALSAVIGDEQQAKEVQYIIYLFAEHTQNQPLQDKYRQILGEQYIQQRKQEATDADKNR